MLNGILRPVKNLLRGPYRTLHGNYLRLRYGFGADELLESLRRIGIEPGDAVLVHSGMSGFGGFRGTVPEIIQTFEKAVGPSGTLLMPTLSMAGSAIDFAKSNRVFDPRTTASQVGLLTEVFRRSPGVVRSVHPTHSVAVWGADKDWWIRGNLSADTPCGRGTPFAKLLERDGKVVLAGVPITALTYFHSAEEMLEPRMPFSQFTTERYTMRCRVDGQIVESAAMRLFDPEVSRRRQLAPLEMELRKAGRWQECRIGTLTAPVLSVKAVLQTLEEMADQGVFCYGAR